MLDMIKKFLIDRVNEKSTLRAITVLVGFFSWKLAPEHMELISEVVVTLLVFFGVLPDKKKSPGELAAEEEANRVAELAAAKKKVAELEGK